MERKDLVQRLLDIDEFNCNKWFDMYVDLISDNISTVKTKGVTQSHHVIPVCYYRSKNIQVDSSSENLVNLKYKDHVRAHCFLALCSKTTAFGSKMFCSVIHILNSSRITWSELERIAVSDLEEYQLSYEMYCKISSEKNVMFDLAIKKKHDDKMRSSEVRSKLSKTMKDKIRKGELMNPEHRANLSKALSNTKYMTHPCGKQKRVKYAEIDKYLEDSWILGRLYKNQLQEYLENIERK